MSNTTNGNTSNYNAVTTSAGITMNLPTAVPYKPAVEKQVATEKRANDFKSSMPSTC